MTQHPWHLLAVLTVAYLLSFMDRQYLSVAVEPVRRDLRLDDIQIGLLTGVAFAACYTLVGIPLARLADRTHRPRLIALGILGWSLATALSGLAASFGELFVARMGVGVGEAVLLPAAYALLGDAFAKDRLPQATGIFTAGAALGAASALFGGGLLLQRLGHAAPFGLSGWRWGFVLFGLLGFGVAALIAPLKDPRPAREPSLEPRETSESLRGFLRRDSRFFVPLSLAGIFLTMFAYGYTAWLPAYFQRVHHWSIGKTGVVMGISIVLTGLVAGPAWGWCGAQLTRRRGQDATPALLLTAAVVLLGLSTVGALSRDDWVATVLIGGIPLFTGAISALAPAALVARTPNRLRAQVMAIFLTAVNLIGISAGPLAYAIATQLVIRDPQRLDLSLAGVSAVLLILSVAVLSQLLRRPSHSLEA